MRKSELFVIFLLLAALNQLWCIHKESRVWTKWMLHERAVSVVNGLTVPHCIFRSSTVLGWCVQQLYHHVRLSKGQLQNNDHRGSRSLLRSFRHGWLPVCHRLAPQVRVRTAKTNALYCIMYLCCPCYTFSFTSVLRYILIFELSFRPICIEIIQ